MGPLPSPEGRGSLPPRGPASGTEGRGGRGEDLGQGDWHPAERTRGPFLGTRLGFHGTRPPLPLLRQCPPLRGWGRSALLWVQDSQSSPRLWPCQGHGRGSSSCWLRSEGRRQDVWQPACHHGECVNGGEDGPRRACDPGLMTLLKALDPAVPEADSVPGILAPWARTSPSSRTQA